MASRPNLDQQQLEIVPETEESASDLFKVSSRLCFPQHIICGFQIHPGLRLDHATAREWCSLFAPEAVFTSVRLMIDPARTVIVFAA
jgi:hypothetical protein